MFGIGPQYYLPIYMWLVSILSVFVFSQYGSYSQSRLGKSTNGLSIGVLLFALFLVVFIGFRPISGYYFVDMGSYRTNYYTFADPNYKITWNTTNKIYDNMFFLLAGSGADIYVFFVLMAAIYFICMAWACSSLFPNDKMAAFLVYLGAFSTFGYGTNGIKAGAAASLFLVALAMFEKRKWIGTVLFLLLSWGFHHSMVLLEMGFVICYFVKNTKYYFALWVVCFLMAALHITYFQHLFSGYADEQGAWYLASTAESTLRHDILGGFRIDFIMYSVVPIVFGWWAIYQKKMVLSSTYTFFLNLYIFANAIWMLCMYAEVTNRISYLSWQLLPIVLIYPFLKENWGSNQYRVFQWVAFGHLAFTLWLFYIYL